MTQHEDHVYNIRAIALAWSLESNDLRKEVLLLGTSLFLQVYSICFSSLLVGLRQRLIFAPLFREHFLRLQIFVDLTRKDGMPTSGDLTEIFIVSKTLYGLEVDRKAKSLAISTALGYADKYREPSSPESCMSSVQEFSWFQLRHAEAQNAMFEGGLGREKELYERNLADDPITAKTDPEMLNAIRRVQYNNLEEWAGCVSWIAAAEGLYEKYKEEILSHFQDNSDDAERTGMTASLASLLNGAEDSIYTIRTRDAIKFAVERETAAISKFGTLAKGILGAPLFSIFDDVAEQRGLTSKELLIDVLRMVDG